MNYFFKGILKLLIMIIALPLLFMLFIIGAFEVMGGRDVLDTMYSKLVIKIMNF